MIMSSNETVDHDFRAADGGYSTFTAPEDPQNPQNSYGHHSEIAVDSLPSCTQQQIEEERLRGDILRYLVKNSNGTYHYSAELRAIIHDVVGIPFKATQAEFQETVTSLLDILHSDPQRRFLISGERDNILVKRCFVRGDEDEISDLVEEWRALIAAFLLESKRSVGLSDIGSSVPRPMRIPSSVKLIFIMKTDPLNRFILKGDGNAAKARYNMQTDPDQESLWVAKWRDDISSFLTKQQWSVPSVALQDIGAHVVRPFFLPPRVKLLDALEADPFQRFVTLGFGNEAHVMIRNFRGDEPEIEEFVEHWRLLIASYLLSKSAMLGVAHPLLGLSEIGANVPRPPGVPTSVKLIDVMRADPRNRFIIKGDGNALRAKINSGGQAGRISFSSMISIAQQQQQLEEQANAQTYLNGGHLNPSEGEYQHNYSQQNMNKVIAARGSINGFGGPPGASPTGGSLLSEHEMNQINNLSNQINNMNGSFRSMMGQSIDPLAPSYGTSQPSLIRHLSVPLMMPRPPNSNPSGHTRSLSLMAGVNMDPNADVQQMIRQAHQLSVQQFHQRQGTQTPLKGASPYREEPRLSTSINSTPDTRRNGLQEMADADRQSGMPFGWNIAGTMSLDRERDNVDGINLGLNPTAPSFHLQRGGNQGLDPRDPSDRDYDDMSYNSNSNYSLPQSNYSFDPNPSQDASVGRRALLSPGHGLSGVIGGPVTPHTPLMHSQSHYGGFGGRGDRSMDRSMNQDGVRSMDRSLERGMTRDGDRSIDRSIDRNVDRSVDRSVEEYLADIPFCRDHDRSPSVGSVLSRERDDINKPKEKPTLQLHQGAYVGSQSGYDSCSTRSEGDVEGEFNSDHTTYFNNYNGQYPKNQNSNQNQGQGRDRLRISPQNAYQNPSSLLNPGSSSDLLSSTSGSRYSNAYSPSDYEDQSTQKCLFPPFDRSPRSSMPQSSTMNNTTTGERSFQSELSDPEQHVEDEAQLSIPLDKWMIKAWLPIVFSGFDYDVIDQFVAQLRDNGGFVTVQDLLDAVARDELTREALADIAGFKVGHCNRLDKALSAYHSKSIPK